MRKISAKRSVRFSIILTALCYSLYHLLSIIPLFAWPYNLLAMIPVFLAGVVWGYMRQLSGSLLGCMVSHILADAGIMGMYLLFVT